MQKKYISFILFFNLLFVGKLSASHLLGADITYQCTGANQYQVTLTLYRDCDGISLSSSQILSYSSSCGNGTINLSQVASADITPLCPGTSSSCAGGSGYGVQEYLYRGTLTLPNNMCNDWVLSWQQCCRNAAINTLSSAGSQNMYVSTTLDNTLNPSCNSSPTFNNTPASYICINQPFVYNHGVADADGDSLYFALGNCYQTSSSSVVYAGGNSATSPLSTSTGVSIDGQTGAIYFTPNQVQVGVLCVVVEEFRAGVKIGEVNRDMQFNVVNCNNIPPTASGVNGTPGNIVTNFQTSICASAPLCFTIDGTDPDGDNVNMTWNEEIPSGIFTVNNNNTTSPQATFCWTPTTADLGFNTFTVNVVDDNCPIVGASTFTYVIEVLPSPNTLTVSNDTSLCIGNSVNLSANTSPIASSITWSPATGLSATTGNNVVATPSVTTTYTVSASFPDGCNLQKTVTVEVLSTPNVSITPSNIFNCAGSPSTFTAISATATNYNWSTGASGNAITVSPNNSTNYYVTATDINGCSNTDTAYVSVAAPSGNVCNVLYVTPTGSSSNSGSQSSPLDLSTAIIQGACNGTIIKMAEGVYTTDTTITSITSYLTLEGGYNPTTWQKTSLAGATTIRRTANNVTDLTGSAPRLIAIELLQRDGFRFQDITIEVEDAPNTVDLNRGISIYGIYMNNCSNYNIVRTQVIAGNAGNGVGRAGGSSDYSWDGRNGNNGSNGIRGGGPECTCSWSRDDGGSGGNGGSGGSGGANAPGVGGFSGTSGAGGGRGGNGRHDNTSARGDWGNTGGGSSGGYGGYGGYQSNNNNSSSSVGNGGNGGSGTNGTNGTTIPSNYTMGYYNPSYGTNGTAGRGGSGGGGGGGAARDVSGCDAAGGGGSGGGAGGGGGGAGKGATGGGSSFPIFVYNDGIGGTIQDCNLDGGTAGSGGFGGRGGDGGNGGVSYIGNGCTNGATDGNTGGRGGNGGAGGRGGSGGNGTNGVATNLFVLGGSAPTYIVQDVSHTINNGGNMPLNMSLSTQPTINSTDISCTNTAIDFTSTSSAGWNFDAGSTPSTATGTNVQTSYSSVGRKDIQYGANTYTGFTNIILDAGQLPTISTNAPIVNGQYKICAGTAINFTANEGGVSYIYHWNLGGGATPNTYVGTQYENLNNITFNTAGVYTIQLQYETNCCGIGTAGSITIYVEEQPTLTLTADQNICANAGTAIPLVASGLTVGGSVQWALSNGLDRTDTTHVLALPSDSMVYNVTLTDSSGVCVANDTIAVNVIDLQLSANATDQVCGADGQITNITVSGGSGNYTYHYNGSPTMLPMTNLFSGAYMIEVQDNTLSCTDSISVYVGAAPTAVVAFINFTGISCHNASDANLTAVANGGTAPYTYNWSSGQTTQVVSGVGAGTYTVTITDALGCSGAYTVSVSNPDSISLQVIHNDTASCVTSSDGNLSIAVDGGVAPFTYVWNTGNPADNQATLQNIPAGYYCVDVTDANGCTKTICDSVYAHTIAPIDTAIQICADDSVFLQGTWQNTAGVFYDTLSASISSLRDTFFVDDFEGANIWTFADGASANGANHNHWVIADREGGVAPGNCAVSNNGDNTLFITNNVFGATQRAVYYDVSAAYITNQDAISNNVSTLGYTNINLTFDYMANGIGLDDNLSLHYSIDGGVTWVVIDNSVKSPVCGSGLGQWALGTYSLPANTYNSSDFQLKWNWVNNGNTLGTQSSVAINNIRLSGNQITGCDTLLRINLLVDSAQSIIVNDTICQGDTLIVNGVNYTTSGNYFDTLHYIASGCDSVHYEINLQVDTFAVEVINDRICQGEVLVVNGVNYTTSGNYLDTAYYANGCDSVHYEINLQVDTFAVEVINNTICQGEVLVVNGVNYTTSGNYFDTLRYVSSGCDSVHYEINLQVDTFAVEVINNTICQGEVLVVNGVNYTTSGNYFDTLRYVSSGCDSVHYEINLQVDTFAVEVINDRICQGEVLAVNGVNYTTSGNYLDTAYYASGCDSVHYEINLQVDTFAVEVINNTICQGEVLVVNGVNYTTSGNYLDTAYYANGCDSVHYEINLQVDTFTVEVINDRICQGEVLVVNGVNYTTSGNYFDTLRYVSSGCDSVHYEINLQVDTFAVEVINDRICQGEVLVVNGVNYTTSGNYLDTAYYASGCDSVHYEINLQVDTFAVEVINDRICQGEVLVVNGVNYTTSGNYFDTAYYASGCDSVHYQINLQVDTFAVEVINDTICQGDTLIVNGVNYTTSGNYFDTLRYVSSGCDSVHYAIALYVAPIEITAVSTSICQGDSVFLAGQWQTTAGVYIDTLAQAITGCDSVIQTTLAVNALPIVNATANDVTLCNGDILILNGNGASTYTWTNGVSNNVGFNPPLGTTSYVVTGTDANACTDTASIIVEVSPTYLDTMSVTICESSLPYTFPDGTIYNTPNTTYQSSTLSSSLGCDSIIVTHLIINSLGNIGALPDTITRCDEGGIDLTITAQNVVNYQWQINTGSGFVNLGDSGIYNGTTSSNLSITAIDTSMHLNSYSITMTDQCGNVVQSNSTYLQVYAPSEIQNPIPDTILCMRDSLLVFADHNGHSYVWQDGQIGQYIDASKSGVYTVSFIENGTNCPMTDEFEVTVEDCIANCVVDAPTGFSPNASGVNDEFKPVSSCEEGFSTYELIIYNRWGEKVFSSTEFEKGWDGTYKGTNAPLGVYVYLLNYIKNGQTKQEQLKGQVTLIR